MDDIIAARQILKDMGVETSEMTNEEVEQLAHDLTLKLAQTIEDFTNYVTGAVQKLVENMQPLINELEEQGVFEED